MPPADDFRSARAVCASQNECMIDRPPVRSPAPRVVGPTTGLRRSRTVGGQRRGVEAFEGSRWLYCPSRTCESHATIIVRGDSRYTAVAPSGGSGAFDTTYTLRAPSQREPRDAANSDSCGKNINTMHVIFFDDIANRNWRLNDRASTFRQSIRPGQLLGLLSSIASRFVSVFIQSTNRVRTIV